MLVGGAALFFVIGANEALFGPAIPLLRTHFRLSASAAGALPSLYFAASIAGMVTWSQLRRFNSNTIVRCASMAWTVCLLVLATRPSWTAVLGAGAAAGFAYGVTTAELNAHFAGRPQLLLTVNAAAGAGAVLAPLLFSLGTPFWMPFVATALLAMAGAVAIRPDPQAQAADPADEARGDHRALVAAFAALLALYLALETGIASWAPTSLDSRGHGAGIGASAVAAYWAGLTISRVAAAPTSRRVHPRVLAVGSLGLATVVLLFAAVGGPSLASYAIVGLALGPAYPAILSWLVAGTPGRRHQVALVLIGGGLGGALAPAAIGALIGQSGRTVVSPALLFIAIAGLSLSLGLRRFARRRSIA